MCKLIRYIALLTINSCLSLDLKFVFYTLSYGTWWRRHRRSFHEHFQPNVVHRYHPNLLKAAHVLLRNLLATPEAFFGHLRL